MKVYSCFFLDTISHTSSNKNAVGFCTVSVLSGTSKNNSFDLPTFNTSVDRTSSVGYDDFCTSSQSIGQGSRGNSFEMPGISFEHYTSDNVSHKETKCQGV
ncbi:hypothetical protein RUM43_010552 [Polyplax serrata]|uniref:Uncharacterized protein n=1 Tax=Polyplax serrata TaxID=468196 RepID=A0AAN8P0J8_POLSC